MVITSLAFAANDHIPVRYSCFGENISPPLSISSIPSKTKSLVLIMHDPDSPSGDWLHWIFWDFQPTGADVELQEGTLLTASEGLTSFGVYGYGGPCPGSGTHHYIFDLYALDLMLSLPASTTREEILKYIEGHVLEHSQLVGVFTALEKKETTA